MKKMNVFLPFKESSFREEKEKAPYLKTTGIVKYNPTRKGLKNNASCCVIEVDQGIIDYYRKLTNDKYGFDLLKPSWSAHISVVQGLIDQTSDLYKEHWLKYDNLEVELEYQIYPRYSGDTTDVGNGDHGWFWFLDVKCDLMKEIRIELGLVTNFSPHLTIGKRSYR